MSSNSNNEENIKEASYEFYQKQRPKIVQIVDFVQTRPLLAIALAFSAGWIISKIFSFFKK